MRRRGALAGRSAAAPSSRDHPAARAHADPGVLVYPGMEIHQGTNVCTLGYVDTGPRIAFTAGHCRGARARSPTTPGNPIGTDDCSGTTPRTGATVATDHMISDWEAIASHPTSRSTTSCPAGGCWSPIRASCRARSAGLPLRRGHRRELRHRRAVNNGWFTMANGVVSQKGDSGGPV